MGQFESDAIFDEIHRVNREADASHKRREPLRRRALSGSFSSPSAGRRCRAGRMSAPTAGSWSWTLPCGTTVTYPPLSRRCEPIPPQGIAGLWDETLSPRDQAQRIATEYPY
jgi:hypothetical protein